MQAVRIPRSRSALPTQLSGALCGSAWVADKSEPSTELPVAPLELRAGLDIEEAERRALHCIRYADAGLRGLAFYLAEIADARLHRVRGFSNMYAYAEQRLHVPRRRTRELLAAGRALRNLPLIDDAFQRGVISWSKVLYLTRVATPETEAEWLTLAEQVDCKTLRREVRLARPGKGPRKRGDKKGLPEIRLRYGAVVDVVTHELLELAQQKLSAERDEAIDRTQLLHVLASQFLNTEEDGSTPGRIRVDSSLYRISVSGDGDAFWAHTSEGPLPIDAHEDEDLMASARSACIACDGEHVALTDPKHPRDPKTGRPQKDIKTPRPLRNQVIARDMCRCRSCGSRHSLMVHHIHHRGDGGPTRPSNLLTLCATCHAMVHANLLKIRGSCSASASFFDREGKPRDRAGPFAAPGRLLQLTQVARAATPPVPCPLASLPREVDARWLRRHEHLLQLRSDGTLVLEPGTPLREREATSTVRSRAPDPSAFDAFIGIDEVVTRLRSLREGAAARDRTHPHTLFTGPAGTGKSSLAAAIALSLGREVETLDGPLVRDPHLLLRALTGLGEGDVLFLDEIHAVPRATIEVLYRALADRCLEFTVRDGSSSRSLRVQLPAFTLIAATTDASRLPDALKSRFGAIEQLGHYDTGALATIATKTAGEQGVSLSKGAAFQLAEAARGTPRELRRLLDRALDEAARMEATRLGRRDIARVLSLLGMDEDGLTELEQRYLATLVQASAPVPLRRLARLLGESPRTLAEDIEPELFRRRLVEMRPGGRIPGST